MKRCIYFPHSQRATQCKGGREVRGERWRMYTIVTFPIRRAGAVLFSDVVSLEKTGKKLLKTWYKLKIHTNWVWGGRWVADLWVLLLDCHWVLWLLGKLLNERKGPKGRQSNLFILTFLDLKANFLIHPQIPHPVLLRWSSALHGGILVLLALSNSPLVPPGLAFSPSQVGPWHGGHGVSADVGVLRVGRVQGHHWLDQAVAHWVWQTDGDTHHGRAPGRRTFYYLVAAWETSNICRSSPYSHRISNSRTHIQQMIALSE